MYPCPRSRCRLQAASQSERTSWIRAIQVLHMYIYVFLWRSLMNTTSVFRPVQPLYRTGTHTYSRYIFS